METHWQGLLIELCPDFKFIKVVGDELAQFYNLNPIDFIYHLLCFKQRAERLNLVIVLFKGNPVVLLQSVKCHDMVKAKCGYLFVRPVFFCLVQFNEKGEFQWYPAVEYFNHL